MTTRERRFLLLGLLFGVAIVALIVTVRLPFPSGEGATEGHTPATPPGPTPPPTAESPTLTVQLTEEAQQKIGLQTTEVRPERLEREIRAVGRVEQPETALSTISARIGGRIDRLFVNFTGQAVRKDEPVALIYSPAIVTAAEEYKLALENRDRLRSSKEPHIQEGADDLVEASRRRLELWGLSKEQIESFVSSPETPIHITTHSTATGIVTARNVTEGQYVKEGDILFTLTDLSTVWVKADVYESDIAQIRPGQNVEITSEALPGVSLRGAVNFIEPVVNEQTRTVPVRIQLPNPQTRLKPGMFVHAAFSIVSPATVLTVPRTAVIATGTDMVVYVAAGDGVFERRPVEVGTPGEDNYTVISGLRAGDRVVTHGAFLIDSQTRLTSGMTGLFGGSKEFAPAQAGQAAPAGEYKMTFRTDPDAPAGGAESTMHVAVTDSTGKPVSDAQVKVTLIMPAMPAMRMPEMRSSADLAWNGSEYVGRINVSMAGPWNVVVEARRGGQVLATYRTRFDAR